MQHALILTMNILTEEELVKKLQRMNYETLCSSDVLKRLKSPTIGAFLGYFHLVLLSENLSNSEVEEILSLLNRYPMLVVRITEDYPSEEEQSYWKELGLADWLVRQDGFEDTRERLSVLRKQLPQESQILAFPTESLTTVPTNFEKLFKSFSKTEKKVFEYLLKAYPEQEVSSRQDMCNHLWSDGSTSSNMSQLSCLINKLKRKCKQHGITGDMISTYWGRGYRLSDDFYQQWVQGTPENSQLYYSATN
ncbi:winged helix-turn-helix domain-containing protein [Enterococcus sp. 669A]|uniref:Winged helix-turn-helix domain-containing protein n=1 Tax=Candidatus Enterococcus moelleringii TaxID=2815325 RepID=A0ABS3L7Z9_9ENTE|nr:winged helix-turn-helix domain-containing protein [Enterococcus sp. 669A]MBO1305737.1 winged helix-turn-helix domain-containing protein [Enterococcus sp. 669A]